MTENKKVDLHSRYWLRFVPDKALNVGSPDYLLHMATINKSIANIVHVVTGQNIKVEFNTDTAFEDNGTFRSDSIVISASQDVDDLDSKVGLALHEAVHMILSTGKPSIPDSVPFGLFMNHAMRENLIPQGIYDKAALIGVEKEDVTTHALLLANFFEDRRIDQWMYYKAVGYRPYYASMYDKMWYSDELVSLIGSPTTQTPTVDNYLFYTLNVNHPLITEVPLPNFDLIEDTMDLNNISRFGARDVTWGTTSMDDFNTSPEVWKTSIAILDIIYSNAKKDDQAKKNPRPSQGKGRPQYVCGIPSNGQPNGEIVRDGSITDLKNVLAQQMKFIKTQIEKEVIPQKLASEIEDINEADIEAREVMHGEYAENKPKVLVYRNFSRRVINSNVFPFANSLPSSEAAVIDGIHLGNLLAHRVRVFNDESNLAYPRQKQGRIDKRAIAGFGTGETNLFSRTMVEKKKPVHFHLSIDASGSMCGMKWHNALALAVACAKMADKTRNIDVSISVRAGISTASSGVAIVYDSRKDDFSKVRTLFPHLHVVGATPEGLAFEAIMKEITNAAPHNRKYFINLSDGEPAMYLPDDKYYSGELAANHTRKQMNIIRGNGFSVLSYFIEEGGSNELFSIMYGKDARFIDPTSVAQIANTLNRLFMAEEQK